MAPLGTVLREWGRIGFTGFGGPAVHVAMLRELVVERRRWLSPREFEDAFAACNLLPGPASTQLAIYCAQRVAGRRGAMVGGLAFVLPGLLAVLVIAAIALAQRPPRWVRGVGAGASAAAVAVIVHTGLTLGRSSLAGRRRGRLARAVLYALAGVAAAAALGTAVVLVLLGCGGVELAWRRARARGAAVHAWPAAVALAVTGAGALPALAWTAFKAGGLAYGGGLVFIPLMQGDAVDAQHWMTAQQFAAAVAYGQLTPGPVTHTVAIVGWAAAGLGGALLAAVVAFTPSFAFVLVGGRRFDDLRASPRARAFLDGAGPAAVGAILGAAVPLAGALGEAWQWVVLPAAAALLFADRPALWALAGGALAGLAAGLLGLGLP